MMKHYLPLAVLLTASALCAQAQITYEYADIPVIGEQITRYRDTMTVYGPGPSGPNQQWSFPSPVTHETIVTSIIAPSATPHAATFTSSNMAMTNDNSSYLFFANTSTKMESTGAAGDLLMNGGNIVSVFNPRLTVHNLPRNYDDNTDDTYYFEVVTTDHGIPLVHSVRLRHYGHVYDSTDAHGLLTTPVGTYDCLRVKSTDHTNDSVWIKLFSFSQWTLQQDFTGRDTSVSYSWIGKESGLALAEMSFDSLDNPKNFTWTSVLPLTTGLQPSVADDVRIYPQPAQGRFTATWPTATTLHTAELFAVDGRRVRSMSISGTARLEMDTDALPQGMYVLRLANADATESIVRKVVVN